MPACDLSPKLRATALTLAVAGTALAGALVHAAPADAPATTTVDAARQRALLRMVRQDCGSCHGMRLTGGLGPALTPQALAERDADSLFATIYYGRPGTPMPPWKALLTETEVRWINAQLRAGLPDGDRP